MQGGGYFLTVKTLTGKERYLNCFAYALGTFGEKLEQQMEMEMGEIQRSVGDSIDSVVERYFESVKQARDGDLAIYRVRGQRTYPVSAVHAGIYRETRPNWNSPPGGSIESEWGGMSNPYVFQHDFFFGPDIYGNTVSLHRLK